MRQPRPRGKQSGRNGLERVAHAGNGDVVEASLGVVDDRSDPLGPVPADQNSNGEGGCATRHERR